MGHILASPHSKKKPYFSLGKPVYIKIVREVLQIIESISWHTHTAPGGKGHTRLLLVSCSVSVVSIQ